MEAAKSFERSLFSKLRTATISFAVSVSPSARLFVILVVRIEQLGAQWTDFHKIWCWSIFQKSVEEIHIWLKYNKE